MKLSLLKVGDFFVLKSTYEKHPEKLFEEAMRLEDNSKPNGLVSVLELNTGKTVTWSDQADVMVLCTDDVYRTGHAHGRKDVTKRYVFLTNQIISEVKDGTGCERLHSS